MMHKAPALKSLDNRVFSRTYGKPVHVSDSYLYLPHMRVLYSPPIWSTVNSPEKGPWIDTTIQTGGTKEKTLQWKQNERVMYTICI